MVGRISIELVARDARYLDTELRRLSAQFGEFSMVNIPDLLRFPVRSWQGCVQAKHYVNSAIPHLRAIDFDPAEPFRLIDYIRRHELTELLVVKGDPPEGDDHCCYDTNSIALISQIKAQLPEVKVFAAIDPYRGHIDEEIAYAQAKLDAGASGFFTQPFFDVALMQAYAERLEQLSPEVEIFWGVSPVIGEGSQKYWQRVNKVVFPQGFAADIGWNQAFAREALAWVQSRQDSIYFMPIRVDIDDYFSGVLY